MNTDYQEIINHFKFIFLNNNLNNEFITATPVPMLVIENFLPMNVAKDLENEIDTISNTEWKLFSRRGSYMEEYNKLFDVPVASKVVNQIHSPAIITMIEQLTGIVGLMPDPHIVGAGYSRSYRNHSLKIHTDFNWNESIKAHRALSLIIYLNSTWNEQYGGNLQFKDKNNEHVVKSISPLFNRAVIWKHDKLGFHGYPESLKCPDNTYRKTLRLFFYTSNSSYDEIDPPHRSLYWHDEIINKPYDIRSEK